ncbi:MAG: DUF4921 family protein [Actinobacteria bacterium]|nr:DUF4921 family protein [Actinomycetota bacterium]MBU1942665.1 DUF4921 family protein [Actinomycetota bacterium]MBU2685987.1 DUF4921 family protein [Actinomycetota bacterium]
MPELRQDIVTGQWVVVAAERARRPTDFTRPPRPEAEDRATCPFCPGNELMTPLETLAVRPTGSEPNTPGWSVRVVPNKFPVFESGGPPVSGTALFPRRNAEGIHEVIIHSPDHDASLATLEPDQVELILRVYRQRYRAHRENPSIRYLHFIINHGRESGASREHSHSQLFGVPLVPPLVHQELAGASWHQTSRGECVFCRITSEEMDGVRRVVLRTKKYVVIAPFASRLPFELWVLPREHQESFDMVDDEQLEDLAHVMKDVLGRYREGFDDPPYNAYLHTSPCDGTEYPYYHWHFELIPKLTTPGGFEMGTSMWINVTTPEDASDFLSGRSQGAPGL